MAGKTLSSGRFRDRAAAGASSSISTVRRILRAGTIREIVAIGLIATVAFLILSIASHDPADAAGAVWPSNETASNLGGEVGASLVSFLYMHFGVATFMVAGLLGIWAIILFLRQNLSAWPVKLAAAVLAVGALAGFFGGDTNTPLAMPSTGGIVGAWLFGALSSTVGLTGTYLALGAVVLTSVLVATDVLFYPLVRDFFRPQAEEDDEPSAGEMFLRNQEASTESESLQSDTKTVAGRMLGLLGIGNSEPAQAVLEPVIEVEPDEELPRDDLVVSLDQGGSAVAADSAPVRPAPKPAPARRPAPKVTDQQPDIEELAKHYTAPELTLLNDGKKADESKMRDEFRANVDQIVDVLSHFKIEAEVVDVRRGPTITLYELKVPPNVPVKRVIAREPELSMMLDGQKVRVIPPRPGRSTIGVEVPNRNRDMVSLKEVVASPEFQKAAKGMQLPLALGLDAEGKPLVRDLAASPHLLIAGTTGSGKSVVQNVILLSLMMSRHWQDVRFFLIDPKSVELTPYQDLGFLGTPVITDMSEAVATFEWLVDEMERRYDLFARTRTKKITEFNELPIEERRKRYAERGGDPEEIPDRLPYLVTMVDELADMLMVNADTRIDELICRVAQKARAAGIHLILATQRPSVDVLTGLLRSNIPARVAFKVPSLIDSRTIINQGGAEKLLGKGDMLIDWNDGNGLMRAQSAFCDNMEIERLCSDVRDKTALAYLCNPASKRSGGGAGSAASRHERFDEAVEAVLTSGRASAQFLRSALRIGYSAATTIIMEMEMAGVLGPSRGSKEREILLTMDEWLAMKDGGGAASEDDDEWSDAA